MSTPGPELARHVAELLGEMAQRLEFTGDNPFRVRAYLRAAKVVAGLGPEFEKRLVTGALKDVPGLGKAILGHVDELLHTGQVALLTELRARVPDGLMAMAAVAGLGAPKALQLQRELGIHTVVELEYAANENRLLRLKGFGPRTQARVLKALSTPTAQGQACRLDQADATAGEVCGALRLLPQVQEVWVVSTVRRRCAVVETLEVLCAVPPAHHAEVLQRAAGLGLLAGAHATSAHALAFDASCGVPGVVHLVAPDDAAATLTFLTGPALHIQRLSERGGLMLTATGALANGTAVHFADETALYGSMGLDFVPPEIRDDEAAAQAAAQGPLPRLISVTELRGSLHNHTLRSDGRNTAQDMLEAAHSMGLKWLGISDHSQSAHFAHGLKAQDLRMQRAEIGGVHRMPGTTLFHGVESDILEDGRLDYPDDVMGQLDYVIASVHSRFRQEPAVVTQRLCRAVAHPATRVLGHATGRLLLGRPPMQFDHEAVLAACAQAGVALEINGHPQRMDPDPQMVRRAVALGIRIMVEADAHGVEALRNLRYAVDVARRAGLQAHQVINTLDEDGLRAWLAERKG